MIGNWEELTRFQNKMQMTSLDGAPLLTRVLQASRMCSGLFMEVAELQDSFSWKMLRDSNRKEEPYVDKENVKREIVDCLFFLHHIAESFGINDTDLQATFIEVMANNRKRHLDGDFSEERVIPVSDITRLENKLDTIIKTL